MNIAHVIPTYYPATRYGGPIRSVHNLCKYLVARGHHVEVFTTDADGDGFISSEHTKTAELEGVVVNYFRVQQPRRIYYCPEMTRALEKRVAEFDVLHLHSTFLYPTLKAARCASHGRVPYVVAPRGMLVKDLIRRKSPFLKNAWIALFERKTVEQAAAIHVTSSLEAAEIRKFQFSLPPLFEIPNGVEAPTEGTEAEREANTVLFLGRLDWKKGLERLVAAIALLHETRLIVAGNDEVGYTSKLKALCEGLGLADRVDFIGPALGAEKWRLYRQAAVFVLPSYSENLANTVLEAMAMECPVVVTPEVGLADAVVSHKTGVVSSGEPTALANAIRGVLDSPEEALVMGRNGRALVAARYSWNDIAAAMESAYCEIVGGNPESRRA